MNDISIMRAGILREIKDIRRFFDSLERSVKSRNSDVIQRAYIFLRTLVALMDDGELSPDKVRLNLELARAFEGINSEATNDNINN